MNANDFLTINEVAAFGRVATATVRGWLHTGKLQKTRVGGRVLISRLDFEAFIKKSNEPASATTITHAGSEAA